ncbi:hypothetical protein N8D56_22335 [Devosia sp. A8/3-2]|nr:hypothetical protein N8D56_22335 [Devosia sp. A8/3-2]
MLETPTSSRAERAAPAKRLALGRKIRDTAGSFQPVEGLPPAMSKMLFRSGSNSIMSIKLVGYIEKEDGKGDAPLGVLLEILRRAER